jgi:hypothetical protein
MTRDEALKELKSGKKITHTYFTSDEYLFQRADVIFTEEGYEVTPEFWDLRSSKSWDEGWEIYKEK